MNFEVIHPETAKFFLQAKEPIEVIALAVSGRHPVREQCFAYMDCTLTYKEVLSTPLALALLEWGGYTAKYKIGTPLKHPLWGMLETLDLQELTDEEHKRKYQYRSLSSIVSRKRCPKPPVWLERHGTGLDDPGNDRIKHCVIRPMPSQGYNSELIEWLRGILLASAQSKNFLLNIDSIISVHLKTSATHKKRMIDLHKEERSNKREQR